MRREQKRQILTRLAAELTDGAGRREAKIMRLSEWQILGIVLLIVSAVGAVVWDKVAPPSAMSTSTAISPTPTTKTTPVKSGGAPPQGVPKTTPAAVSATSANAMSFVSQWSGGNCNTCEWIAASGDITPSTPTDFENFMSGKDLPPDARIVYLSSPGGSVVAAMQLGRLFRKFGITTVVGKSIPNTNAVDPIARQDEREIAPSDCMSACILAFAGGKSRYYRSKGWAYSTDQKDALGVHQFYSMAGASPEERNMTAQAAKAFGIEDAQVLMGVEMAYLAEMGVDPLLLTVASATKPGDIYILSEAEAETFKLSMPQDLQPEWQLTFYGQALVAQGQGDFQGTEYHVALWCPDHSQERLIFTIRLRVDLPDDEIKPFQYYVTTADLNFDGPDLATAIKNYYRHWQDFPISFMGVNRKGGFLALSFGVEGQALAVLRSGEAFFLSSNAPRSVEILPRGKIQLDPRIVPTLLNTCER